MSTRIPDPIDNPGIDELVQHIRMLQGMINGYAPFGAPARFNQWDGLAEDGTVSTDFANNWSTTESSVGRAFQGLDGLDRIIIQGTNDGLYGELNWETTQNMTVGIDLTVGRDGAFGRDVGITRNLAVGNDAIISGDLAVTLTSTLIGNVGVAGAPDSAVQLKVTGNEWVTGKLGVGATVGDETVVVTGTEQVTQRLGVGAAPDATAAMKVTGATIMTGNLTVDTNVLLVDTANNWIGVNTTAPAAPLDVTGTIRAMSLAPVAPASGTSVEMLYDLTNNVGIVLAYDRSGAAYKDMAISGLSVQIRASAIMKFQANTTGIGFFTTTPVAQQAGDGGGSTADVLWSAGEAAMLQKCYDALYAYGLLAG